MRALSTFAAAVLLFTSAHAVVPDDGLPIAEVWAGHPVGFYLLTAPPRQFVAFYDADRQMVAAQRDLDSAEWDYHVLPERVGWDSHNDIVMAMDRDGHIHLAGNMHNVTLRYFLTETPGDITTLERVESMTGEDEERITYPRFRTAPDGAMLFFYRIGGSGRGNEIINRYDEETRTWSRLLDVPLVDGEGERNAYFDGPHPGPDGYYHMCWVWRDTPDCETNHSLSYARSPDMLRWERSDGTPLDLPITLATGEVVDPVPPGGGLINGNARLGFDTLDRPVIAYHKHDENGHTNIYTARLERGEWVRQKVSDWDYRWEFSGRGSINFDIRVHAVRAHGGHLELRYSHAVKGGGRFVLDAVTMKVLGTRPPPEPLQPAHLRRPESDFEGMAVRWSADNGQAEAPGVRYMLRWETLDRNRDRPRDPPLPEPSELRLFRFETNP